MVRVGRTLLSDAFDLFLTEYRNLLPLTSNCKTSVKIKSVGQECPTHTNLTHTGYAA